MHPGEFLPDKDVFLKFKNARIIKYSDRNKRFVLRFAIGIRKWRTAILAEGTNHLLRGSILLWYSLNNFHFAHIKTSKYQIRCSAYFSTVGTVASSNPIWFFMCLKTYCSTMTSAFHTETISENICCQTWIRTKILASKGRCPTIRRSGKSPIPRWFNSAVFC
jgi:hypothetical protein